MGSGAKVKGGCGWPCGDCLIDNEGLGRRIEVDPVDLANDLQLFFLWQSGELGQMGWL